MLVLSSILLISQVIPHAELGHEVKYVSWSEFYNTVSF